MNQCLGKMLIISMAIGLGACSHHAPSKEKIIGQPNPAAAYCVAQKGTLKFQKDLQGNMVGYCHLKNGKIVEEWDFFRKSH